MPRPPVLAGLAVLDPLEREAILLAYFQERTQLQIAQTLDVPQAAVARAIASALRRLALFLSEADEEDALSEGLAS